MSGIWHIKTDAVGCEVEADSLDEACAKFATAERLKAQSAYGLAEEMEKLVDSSLSTTRRARLGCTSSDAARSFHSSTRFTVSAQQQENHYEQGC